MKKLAIFISGGGSNFRAIQASILAGRIEAQVALVVTDKPQCPGARYAREQGIEVYIYPTHDRQPT
ncbi:MAG: phosphoribosylglycinamide formyltransferase, partial [Candidatus Marinimicrobia bacterium]|nr:phosphoribosylglycinamide formyltransferase [Candidatus Neomarinimicrobiota bacterium]